MPQLDIVCATWNMENQEPSNDQIVQFCNGLLKKPFQDPPAPISRTPPISRSLASRKRCLSKRTWWRPRLSDVCSVFRK